MHGFPGREEPMIDVACHCGAVRLTVPRAPVEVTECNCSICRRLGARWAYYAPASPDRSHMPQGAVA